MVRPLYVLMELYAQYDPSFLLPCAPKSNLGFGQFLHVDDEWSERILEIQRNDREHGISDVSSVLLEAAPQMTDFRLSAQISLQLQALLRDQPETFQVRLRTGDEK